ncbi:MFS transporter [Enterococcus cecorum]|uniref:Multidrug resistance protein n=2 Tax=Enterococcus cecorum TaxID=44008 RepID=A0A366SJ32_9ENTE|nr:multidrug resistance protein [Enterococcus cecorum]
MNKKNVMLIIAISNLFLIFTGVGLVIPVMPLLMEDMHFNGAIMGMMLSVFSITQLLASPIMGYLSDKIGRKKMIVLGMSLFAISEFIFGFANDKYIFYLSRGLGGVAAALLMPAVTAFVADMTTIEQRPKAMGYVSAAISGGFIIGPGIGGVLASLGHRVPFFAAGIIAIIGCLLTQSILIEPQHDLLAKNTSQKTNAKEIVREFLSKPGVLFIFIIIFISSFGLQAFESIYTIMTTIIFGFNPAQIAVIITVSGVLALFFQLFLFDHIIRKISEIGLIQITFFVSAIFIFIIAFTKNSTIFVIATFVVFLAFDLFRPAVTTYLSKIAGENQGTINGLNSTFTSFGNIIGPVASGALFDLNQHFPYYISASILFITGILSLFIRKSQSRE